MIVKSNLWLFLCIAFLSCKDQKTNSGDGILIVLNQLRVEESPYGKMFVNSKFHPVSNAIPFSKSIVPSKYLKIKIGNADTVDALFGKIGKREIMLFDANRNKSFLDDQILDNIDNYPVKIRLLNPILKDSFRVIEKNNPAYVLAGSQINKNYSFIVHQPYRYGVSNLGGNLYQFANFNYSINVNDPFNERIRSLVIVSDSTKFPNVNQAPVRYRKGDTIYLGRNVYFFDKLNKSGDSLYLVHLATTPYPYGIQVDQLAFSLKGYDINSESITNPILTGKYTLIDFWGTWCGPCRELTPKLKELNQLYDKNLLQVISVAFDDNLSDVIDYTKKSEMNWMHLFDQRGKKTNSLVEKYKVSAFPTFILVDKAGKIVLRESGVKGYQVVEDYLHELFKNKY